MKVDLKLADSDWLSSFTNQRLQINVPFIKNTMTLLILF